MTIVAKKKVSRDELARLLKVSRATIDHAISNGLLELDDFNMLDLEPEATSYPTKKREYGKNTA